MSCRDYQEDHVGLHLPGDGEQPYCLFWGKRICVLGLSCKWEGRPIPLRDYILDNP